jgi:pimeloyl-ACP methyl ester carboxylesterase
VKDGQIIVNDAQNVFFNDVPHDEAQKWAHKTCPEPTMGWGEQLTYMGWRDIPSHYIICEKDGMLPVEVQDSFARLAGSTLVRMDAGHFPQVSKPEELARIIDQITAKV